MNLDQIITALWPRIQMLVQPVWQTWSPTCTGFSAQPTNSVYRYCVQGKLVTCAIRQGTAGTSNAISFTIPLPLTAATITNMAWGAVLPFVTDHGAILTTAGAAAIQSGATAIFLYTTAGGGAWTDHDGKGVGAFVIQYEIP